MKSCHCVQVGHIKQSHPSRGAWIEIVQPVVEAAGGLVAPLAGCVD